MIKTSIVTFAIAVGCLVRLGNIEKLTCWHSKVVVILIIWIARPSFSYYWFLLIFWENGKVILVSKLFWTGWNLALLVNFSSLTPLKKQHFQSEMSFPAISKFRFKNDNLFYLLLLILSGDASLNPGLLVTFSCSNKESGKLLAIEH